MINCVFQQRIKKVLAVQSCSQATEKTKGGEDGWKDGWKEEGKWRSWPYTLMYWLHYSSPILPLCNRSVSFSYNSLTPHILPLPFSLCSVPNRVCCHIPSFFLFFFPISILFTSNLFPMPLFFLCHPLPNRRHARRPPPAPPPSFPPLLLLLLFLYFSTRGTPGSRRRWSISILPLGFLSPVWGRPCLPSPSGSERHYWPPHASHPGHQQTLKSPASRCASGSPG